jgi:hypothetical protein
MIHARLLSTFLKTVLARPDAIALAVEASEIDQAHGLPVMASDVMSAATSYISVVGGLLNSMMVPNQPKAEASTGEETENGNPRPEVVH